MYQDPALIRKHRVSFNLNDEEFRLVQAVVDYTGQERGALLRDLILEAAAASLGNCGFGQAQKEVALSDLLRAA